MLTRWPLAYVGQVYVRSDGLASVVITDTEYPMRVAFGLANRLLDDFASQIPQEKWKTSSSPLSFPELKTFIVKYQNPNEADSILKIQKELDETKIALVRFDCINEMCTLTLVRH